MNMNHAPSSAPENPDRDPGARLKRGIRGTRFAGLLIIFIMFFGLGSWASLAPLSSAAIAIGQVSPDGSQRTVQHLEGGIVSELKIREGDTVTRGQPLIILDRALALANFQSRLRKLKRLEISRDRLLALQNRASDFSVDLGEDWQADPTFVQFARNEQMTFGIKQKLFNEQIEIFRRQEQQVLNEIDGLAAQEHGLREQVQLLETEIGVKEELLRSGLTRMPELLALQRKRAELIGEANALVSTAARAHQKIEEIKIAILSFESESFEKIAEQLAQLNTEISQAEEAFRATGDVLKRTEILSPINGRVLKLHSKTLGGVVRPGEPIAVIVPEDEELIVDARLTPSDIDNVQLGMKANVQFMSFMARHMKPMQGEVTRIGADVVTDPQTGEIYYPLRVRVDRPEEGGQLKMVDLHPGMPADVFLQTGTHTPLQYVFGPILQSFHRAFREEPV
jgi:HlyD family secretion protein/epimerase transport system membrane fusion protein